MSEVDKLMSARQKVDDAKAEVDAARDKLDDAITSRADSRLELREAKQYARKQLIGFREYATRALRATGNYMPAPHGKVLPELGRALFGVGARAVKKETLKRERDKLVSELDMDVEGAFDRVEAASGNVQVFRGQYVQAYRDYEQAQRDRMRVQEEVGAEARQKMAAGAERTYQGAVAAGRIFGPERPDRIGAAEEKERERQKRMAEYEHEGPEARERIREEEEKQGEAEERVRGELGFEEKAEKQADAMNRVRGELGLGEGEAVVTRETAVEEPLERGPVVEEAPGTGVPEEAISEEMYSRETRPELYSDRARKTRDAYDRMATK